MVRWFVAKSGAAGDESNDAAFGRALADGKCQAPPNFSFCLFQLFVHYCPSLCMFSATLRRAIKMSSTTTSAPFSKAVVGAMRKLLVVSFAPLHTCR